MAVKLDPEDAIVDLQFLREDASAMLEEILGLFSGTKCVVFDPSVTFLLTHVIPNVAALLKECGVVCFQELQDGLRAPRGGEEEADHIVYLVRPRLSNMKAVAQQLKERARRRGEPAAAGAGGAQRHGVFFVPHITLACEQALADEGALQLVQTGELNLDLVPFDRDVVSAEIDDAFRASVEGDTTALTSAARALLRFQACFGLIPNVKAKGPSAKTVLERMLRLRLERDMPEFEQSCMEAQGLGGGPAVDTLVIIDREADLVTPMLTPLTYEGLIDAILGIRGSAIRVDAGLVGAEAAAGEEGAQEAKGDAGGTVKVALNSNDELFAQIRDMNTEALGAFLQERAKGIKEMYSSFRDNKNASVSEIHGFIKQIPGLKQRYKSLEQHINIAQLVKRTTDGAAFRERWQVERGLVESEAHLEALEERMAAQEPPLEVLKLLCLQSLCCGGIRSKQFDALRRDFLQTYGYEFLLTLNALERLGALRKKDTFMDTGGNWAATRRAFELVSDEVDVIRPTDLSYVTSGYAPLSVRIVQFAASPGWQHFQEAMRLLPGPAIEIRQAVNRPESLQQAVAAAAPQQRAPAGAGQDKPVMMVFFVGGITYMEIAALRFLSRAEAFPYRILIGTTKITSGSQLLQSLAE